MYGKYTLAVWLQLDVAWVLLVTSVTPPLLGSLGVSVVDTEEFLMLLAQSWGRTWTQIRDGDGLPSDGHHRFTGVQGETV